MVAVIDTGISLPSIEFADRLVPGYNFVDDNDFVADLDGHGSMVAGVLAATGNNGRYGAGVDWRCSIMPLKILGGSRAGLESRAAAAFDFAVAHGARVINASWGGSISDFVRDAIHRAKQAGVVVVAGSGNGSLEQLLDPADFPGVISVGASDREDAKAPFSNWGRDLDIVAPGVDIYVRSVNGEEWMLYGTSLSTPQVAAAAALILAIRPEYTPQQVEALLYLGADDVGEPGKDPQTGWGRLNVRNSLMLARNDARIETAGEGAFRLAWESPLNAEGRVRHRIERSGDLVAWAEILSPEIRYEEGFASWSDALLEDEPPSPPSAARFFRVSVESELDLSPRVIRRFDVDEPHSRFVWSAKRIDPFAAEPEALAAYEAAVEQARGAGAATVEGYYLCRLKPELFPYLTRYELGEPAGQ